MHHKRYVERYNNELGYREHILKESKDYRLRVKSDPELKKKRDLYFRKHRLEHKFGITLEQYDSMLKDQDFGCAICGTTDFGKRRKYFHVDHNHKTGKVRGLLCNNCNAMLGMAKDDSNILESGIKYLKKYRENE